MEAILWFGCVMTAIALAGHVLLLLVPGDASDSPRRLQGTGTFAPYR